MLQIPASHRDPNSLPTEGNYSALSDRSLTAWACNVRHLTDRAYSGPNSLPTVINYSARRSRLDKLNLSFFALWLRVTE
jgi:hypothetical protein